jgi:predicted secreted protein
MSRIAGKAGSVLIDATVPAAVLGVTSWDADLQGDVTDTTGMDSGGTKEFLAGLTSGTASVECFSDGTLNTDIRPGLTVLVNLKHVSTDANYWYGDGIVTSVKPTVAVDGAVKFSLGVQFSGTVTWGSR